ncbi:MAG: tRNA (guanosine(37)-N1)-methyltransferase TrmD [Chloroflexota bacterium]|nr:tRNA (guanosine(37)-N1)-methyltransferase TrmD [Chloroflexota bacterium]MDE2685284.1 tRNA (guanosine(37)-N1)-methyltransferase TrmD [Chloroflexota bacterium]
MRFHVLTLFPEAFRIITEYSIIGRAVERGLISVEATAIRQFTTDRHGTADDYQFGGGPGMVMKPEPVFAAVDAALANIQTEERERTPIALTSPQGHVLNQQLVDEFAAAPGVVIICGHYAGVDERIRTGLITHEVSIGDYVLTGGELAAMVIIDAVSRFVPDVVGSEENVRDDSITSGLLQHPLYTRPAAFRGMAAPEVLRSGNHAEIERWRRRQSLERTLKLRPDLLATAALTNSDRAYLASLGWDGGDV